MTTRRNLVLNLRIKSNRTKMLGLDMHVCELQLTLQSFANLAVMPVRAS